MFWSFFMFQYSASEMLFHLFCPQKVLVFRAPSHVLSRQRDRTVWLSSTSRGSCFKRYLLVFFYIINTTKLNQFRFSKTWTWAAHSRNFVFRTRSQSSGRCFIGISRNDDKAKLQFIKIHNSQWIFCWFCNPSTPDRQPGVDGLTPHFQTSDDFSLPCFCRVQHEWGWIWVSPFLALFYGGR